MHQSENKIAVISQPRYLPACNYIHRMTLCDIFIYLDTVQYTPRDFENRNKIKTPHGPIYLTVPVKRDYREQPLKEIKIDNSQNWGKKHWGAIRANYAGAPCFSQFADFFFSSYQKTWHYLIDLNEAIVNHLLQELKIQCQFVRASELTGYKNKGQDLLISLCRNVNATTYLSGPLGRNYIDEEKLKEAGIQLYYHDYQHPNYPQLWGGFIPYMGIVDLLFNCGPKSQGILMSGNVSKNYLHAKTTDATRLAS